MTAKAEQLTITVYGTPGPQGSKRFMGVKGGKGVLVESSKKVKPWREAVKWAAWDVIGVDRVPGPVRVDVHFTEAKQP